MTDQNRLPSEALAEFIARAPASSIPDDVLRESKRHILDTLGTAIGARATPAVTILRDVLREQGGQQQAHVLGDDLVTSITSAARLNGVMSHVLDFDDTHIPTILHPSGPTLSAVLPLAELRKTSGRDVLVAFALGLDAGCRVALALGKAHYDIGWHITGTAGPLAAAGAAARLLQLDPARTHTALSIAATEAAGHRVQFGAMTKSLHTGNAAANGLLAALLAERGYTASREGLEGTRGLLNVASTAPAPEELSAELGERWEIFRVGIKPYSCGVVTHPGIDAVRQLAQRTGAAASEVESLELAVHPLVLELTGKPRPRTGLEGKFSIAFASAITWLEGTARQSQFTDEKVQRPDVQELRDRVHAAVDQSLSQTEAKATVRLRDGRVETVHVTDATGTPGNRISDQELREKFIELTAPHLKPGAAQKVIGYIERLEDLEDLSTLLDALQSRNEGTSS